MIYSGIAKTWNLSQREKDEGRNFTKVEKVCRVGLSDKFLGRLGQFIWLAIELWRLAWTFMEADFEYFVLLLVCDNILKTYAIILESCNEYNPL